MSTLGHQYDNSLVSNAFGFLRLPMNFMPYESDADWVITGVPFDMATSGRAGGRHGPAAIRQVSTNLAWEHNRFPWNFDMRERLNVVDCGDLVYAFGDAREMSEKLQAHAEKLLAAGKRMLSFGGDHFVTLPLLRAHAKHFGKMALVHFDAHTDTYANGCEFDHGTMFYTAPNEGLIDPNHSVQIGIRTEFDKDNGFTVLDAGQVNDRSVDDVIAQVKQIVGERARFTVVGDDDQSIYSWRGAKPQNLVLLSEDFPSLKLIKLEQNYRSKRRILKCANILIANNPHVYDKALFSELDEGVKLKVLFAKNEEHEAERIAAEMMGHKFMNRTRFKDYAILYRGNHQSRIFEKALMTNRIPYRISGGTSFFSRTEIKDIMAYLKLLVNPDEDTAFLRVVNLPRREIGPTTLEKLGQYANQRGKSLFAASFELGLEQHLSGRGLVALQAFTNWLVRLGDQALRGNPVEAVRDMIKEIHYEEWLYETSPSPKAAEMRMQNVSTLYRWITEMLEGDELEESMTLAQVVTRLTLRDMMERNEGEDDADQVQLMTLHASKGLEFPYVYMVGMEEGLLPHQTSIDEDNVEEERRLAYVGITRAQTELTFTLCKERRQYGESVRPEPSRFLLELPQDDLEWENQKKVTAEERQQKGQVGVANLRALFKKD